MEQNTLKRLAVYPGSFDPITNGHMDILERALRLFDRVVLAVAPNEKKKPLFSAAERADLAREALLRFGDRVEVTIFNGLMVEFARKQNATAVVRGLRLISDFEFEFQLNLSNRKLAPNLETLFLMPKDHLIFLSSSFIKELASFGGDVSPYVPQNIEAALKQKYSTTNLP